MESNMVKACNIGIAQCDKIIEQAQKAIDKKTEIIGEQQELIRLFHRALVETGAVVEETEKTMVDMPEITQLDEQFD